MSLFTFACEPYRELLSADLDDELTAQESRSLHAHLLACPECRRRLRDYRRLRLKLNLLYRVEILNPVHNPGET